MTLKDFSKSSASQSWALLLGPPKSKMPSVDWPQSPTLSLFLAKRKRLGNQVLKEEVLNHFSWKNWIYSLAWYLLSVYYLVVVFLFHYTVLFLGNCGLKSLVFLKDMSFVIRTWSSCLCWSEEFFSSVYSCLFAAFHVGSLRFFYINGIELILKLMYTSILFTC